MNLWVPRPSDIVAMRATGTGDMGTVTDRQSTARFSLPTDMYALVWVRAIFTGGTLNATMRLQLDHREDIGFYDFILRDWPNMGTTEGDDWVYSRKTADEQHQWVFHRGDVLVFTWTNPDPAVMRWSLEVGLADATGQ